MSTNDSQILSNCPFCGGENVETSYKDTFSGDFRRGVYCADCCGGIYPYYDTEAEAIAAWNNRTPIEYEGWFYLPKPKERIVVYGEPEITRTENGYKVRRIADVVDEAARRWGEELGEYVMRRICEIWNTHATQGTLTAEQVREAIEANSWAETSSVREFNDSSWQAIADELNARAERTCEEIVRCRDCKYRELVPEDSGDWCEYWTDRVYRVDGFCAWGARADEQRDGNGTCPDGNETCPNHSRGERREP